MEIIEIKQGWDAPSFDQQFPDVGNLAVFDRCNAAISVLVMMGIITGRERDAARARLAKKVAAIVAAAREAA